MEQSLNIKITPLNLIKFAFPTVIAQIFMGIYSMADGIFVSNVIGTNALSAVNIVMPYVLIVLAFGVMIGTGGSAIISAQLGESSLCPSGMERQSHIPCNDKRLFGDGGDDVLRYYHSADE